MSDQTKHNSYRLGRLAKELGTWYERDDLNTDSIALRSLCNELLDAALGAEAKLFNLMYPDRSDSENTEPSVDVFEGVDQ